ncbi:MAG: MFS transporter [Chloroflexi bacterium]|nr:MFS transporter [Chloroflexota bacterium]
MPLVSVLGRRRFFYGWVIVGSGFVGQLFNSGLGFQGFGTYLIPLQQEFGWSKTALSLARSVMQVESGIVDPVVGFLVDRLGPRILTTVGTFFFGLGLVLFSRIHSLWSYYAVFLIMAVGSSLGGFLVMTVAVNNWFRRRRALANSLAQLGLGVGGIIVIPVLVWAQTAYGWRVAALASGFCVWVIGIPVALLMRHAPERYGLTPDGDSSPGIGAVPGASSKMRPPDAGDEDFTLGEALRTPAFWLIAFGHGLSIVVISSAAVHQFAHMEQGMGISRASAAAVVTVLSVSSIIGRLLGGVLGDRYPKRYLAAAGTAGSAAALAILATATSLGQAMLFGVLHGFSWGMRGPLMSAMRGEYFGRASFGKITGMSSVIIAPCSLFGPVLAGIIADIRGDYQLAFVILSIVSGVGSALFLFARPPAPPRRARFSATPHPLSG